LTLLKNSAAWLGAGNRGNRNKIARNLAVVIALAGWMGALHIPKTITCGAGIVESWQESERERNYCKKYSFFGHKNNLP